MSQNTEITIKDSQNLPQNIDTNPTQPVAMRPRVVIIGGGFGGLNVARALGNAPVQVTVIDRSNHHLFQPLLYQVATAALSPADISAPIRGILSRQANTNVIFAEATGIDLPEQCVLMTEKEWPFDYLILATGARH